MLCNCLGQVIHAVLLFGSGFYVCTFKLSVLVRLIFLFCFFLSLCNKAFYVGQFVSFLLSKVFAADTVHISSSLSQGGQGFQSLLHHTLKSLVSIWVKLCFEIL